MKHYAPNRCLCIKVAKSTICNWLLGWGVQRCHNYKINCGVKICKEHCRYFTHTKKPRWMSTKKNYFENAKKSHLGAGYQLWCVLRTEFIVNMRKKEVGGGGGGGGGGSGQGGCERRIEVFMKILNKSGEVGVGAEWVGECQGGCERRTEVFVKIQNKNRGGGGGGGRVDVDKELKFLWK